MDVRPLHTEEDYQWALTEVERYFDKEPELGTPDAARFDVLSVLIEAYETKHWSVVAREEILARLDAPPADNPKLRELLQRKAVWERPATELPVGDVERSPVNNVMSIEGYQAVIQFDADIGMLRGEFIGLNGGADFYADSVAGLLDEGKKSLRVFLDACRGKGISPVTSR